MSGIPLSTKYSETGVPVIFGGAEYCRKSQGKRNIRAGKILHLMWCCLTVIPGVVGAIE
jgi:hypothetical protein